MDESSRLIDIVVFCIAGFIVPVFYCLFLVGGVENTTVQVKVQSFAENVSTKGYVDYAMYESFVEELNSVGVLVHPEFHVEHELLAPEYMMRSIEDAEGYLDGLWSGSNILNQGMISVQRPAVTDPGTPPAGSLTGNVAGANTSTTGPSASHSHSGACYTGTQHIHDASCPSREISCTGGCTRHTHSSSCSYSTSCTAGCSTHTHSGSSSSGGGCYGSSRFVVCSGSFSSTGGSSYSGSCGQCGAGVTVSINYLSCSVCGRTASESRYHCSSCVYSYGEHRSGAHGNYVYSLNCGKTAGVRYSGDSVCGSCGGDGVVSYTNCGKTSGRYYDSRGRLCSTCGGDGKETTSACTKTNGGYYNADGTACTALCNKVVTSMAAVVKEQVLVSGTGVDARVKVVFADGHSEIVNATVTGFNSTAYNVVQTVTLSYGTYSGSLSNKTKTKCTIKVMVRYPTKTCGNGHLYYLVSGDATPCPYCKAYPKTLTVLGAAEEPFHTIKGTTLTQNGISLKVTYYDGRVEILTSGWQDNFDMNYIGEQTVTITYLGATTTLKVYNDRVKVPCSVCGYEYALYPDNTDPGCPKCLAAIPVFTGNVLRYSENVSYGEILDELYHGDGIYYFSRGDRLEMQIWKTEKTPVNTILGKLFGGGIGEELVSMYSVKVRDEKVRK